MTGPRRGWPLTAGSRSPGQAKTQPLSNHIGSPSWPISEVLWHASSQSRPTWSIQFIFCLPQSFMKCPKASLSRRVYFPCLSLPTHTHVCRCCSRSFSSLFSSLHRASHASTTLYSTSVAPAVGCVVLTFQATTINAPVSPSLKLFLSRLVVLLTTKSTA